MAQVMDITRTLEFNLGQYEQMKVTVTIRDIPITVEATEISETLDDKMAGEVARAVFATAHHPDDNVTSIFTWDQIIKEGMNA